MAEDMLGLLPTANDLGWTYGVQQRRLIAFSLDGEAVVPKQPPKHYPEPLFEAGFEIDGTLAEEGSVLYLQHGCYACHGVGVQAAGMAPDLRSSAMMLSEMEPFFKAVVRDGITPML